MRRFYKFRFCWGYAESQRICEGPVFYHVQGFTDPMEVLESFRLLLVMELEARADSPHLAALAALRRREILTQEQYDDAYTRASQASIEALEVVDFFDSLWKKSWDDLGSFRDRMEETPWTGSSVFPGPLETLTFYGTERWLEEAPGYDEEDYREVDQADLPAIYAMGEGCAWVSRRWKSWGQ